VKSVGRSRHARIRFRADLGCAPYRRGLTLMTHKTLAVLAAAGIACLGGCGTITQGVHQDISVSSSPPGAACDLTKPDGTSAGTISSTPGKVHVRKTKYDLLMTCKLAGYQDSSTYLKSGIATGTYGNLILGGAIGWGIDSAVGADNQYPSTALVTLVPATGAAAAAPSSAAPTSGTSN